MRLATLALDEGGTAAVSLSGETATVIEDRGRTFTDVGELLRSGPEALGAAAAIDPSRGQALDRAQLRRPVLDPGAIICVGLNYRDHIEEMGREMPKVPTLFGKFGRALTDPFADLLVPPGAAPTLDYEGELAIVIGRAGRDIAPVSVWEHIAGLTILNDISVRDEQWRTTQWLAGKTWQSLTPVGPEVVTVDELPDLGESELTVTVNGETRQRSKLHNLVFGVEALVTDISRIIELRPGDLIATGTPGGVGAGMEPKGYLGDGDVVEVRIEGIGTITNRVVYSAG
ncbi:MAG TPA: fumarylacetoacetate hydrolase family protein [Solirubrobacterales bacterium]